MTDSEDWLYSPAFGRAVAKALAGEGIILSPERWAILVEKIRNEEYWYDGEHND